MSRYTILCLPLQVYLGCRDELIHGSLKDLGWIEPVIDLELSFGDVYWEHLKYNEFHIGYSLIVILLE